VRRAPPSQSGNATRVAAELVGGFFVGGGIGWGTDRIFHTAPWGMVVFFILGAAARHSRRDAHAQKINAAAAQDIEEK